MKKLLFTASLTIFSALAAQAQDSKEATPTTTIATPVAPVAPDSVKLKEYAGFYSIANNAMVDKMTIIYKDGNLYGQAGEYPEAKLIFKKEDEFEDSGFGAQMFFKRTDNAVSSIKILVQDMEIIAVKEVGKK